MVCLTDNQNHSNHFSVCVTFKKKKKCWQQNTLTYIAHASVFLITHTSLPKRTRVLTCQQIPRSTLFWKTYQNICQSWIQRGIEPVRLTGVSFPMYDWLTDEHWIGANVKGRNLSRKRCLVPNYVSVSRMIKLIKIIISAVRISVSVQTERHG